MEFREVASAINLGFYTRFKQRHPEKLVLIHCNGNSRDPRYRGESFFAGHWLYHEGCLLTQDLPAEGGESLVHVEDPHLFKTGMGRYADKGEDVVICGRKPDGRLDYFRAEQLELLAVDHEAKTLRVRRGAYGTRPVAWKKGEAYLAAHICRGPWCEDCNFMWAYNYSPTCPRDSRGRSCIDVLVDELAGGFAAGGKVASIDGIEFDGLLHFAPRNRDPRGVDTDGDGKADQGFRDGVNLYGQGVYEFCRRLRERLGKDRLILADGAHSAFQRAFGCLNGIENEGFPDSRDFEIAEWSTGMNRNRFWRARSVEPLFQYLNHRFVEKVEGTARYRPIDIPFSRTRLLLAAGQMLDAAFTFGVPETKEGDWLEIYDELCMGSAKRTNWLGQPVAPPVQLALDSEDLFGGQGRVISQQFLKRMRSEKAVFERPRELCIKVRSKGSVTGNLGFAVTGVELSAADAVLCFRVRAEPLPGCPPAIARWVKVACRPAEETKRKQPLSKSLMTWADGEWFEATFYFRNLKSGTYSFEFNIERTTPVYLSNITWHAHPDVMLREFEHGLVLANPSMQSYSFNLAELAPGKLFHRLQGSWNQDRQTNDGSKVGNTVVVPPRDGLFLIKDTR
jgi:hypothetical protein